MFAGPGLGILLTGLLALGSNLLGEDSATLWLVYGVVALVASFLANTSMVC